MSDEVRSKNRSSVSVLYIPNNNTVTRELCL